MNNTFLTSFTHKNGVISGAISGVNRDELEAKEKIILSEIETNPNLSTRELSENLNIPFRSVQRYIFLICVKRDLLKELELIKMDIGKL